MPATAVPFKHEPISRARFSHVVADASIPFDAELDHHDT
jgi:hypothetical protein